MFCPQCGITQSEELKFCKACGANLYAVRQVVTTREASEKFDWSKTWVAEMFLSHEELKKRKRLRESSISREEKRYNEIKAGVITSFVGISLMIFLNVLMRGIILGGNVPADAAEILSRIWIAGVIPFFVGLALIVNGLVVSRKLVELARREQELREPARMVDTTADWQQTNAPPSVTESTTRQLKDSTYREVDITK